MSSPRRARARLLSFSAKRQRGGGRRTGFPKPGWQAFDAGNGFSNPRLPAVPATLNLNLEEYYAAASLMGLLASQIREPNRKWAKDWSFRMAAEMAAEARRRRRKARAV